LPHKQKRDEKGKGERKAPQPKNRERNFETGLIPRKLTHEKELRLQETKGKERIEKLTGEQMSPLDKSEQGREKLPLFARFFS
jgi:hypothetical protein